MPAVAVADALGQLAQHLFNHVPTHLKPAAVRLNSPFSISSNAVLAADILVRLLIR